MVDSKEQLMIRDGDGRKSLDLKRIIKEGVKKSSTMQESESVGAVEETGDYEYFTMEGRMEKVHTIKITRKLDDVFYNLRVHNAMEPWVIGHVKIRQDKTQ